MSIKTTLAGKYSYAMLGSSQTTLLRVFTYKMLPKEYLDSIEQDFFLCIIVSSLKDNIA